MEQGQACLLAALLCSCCGATLGSSLPARSSVSSSRRTSDYVTVHDVHHRVDGQFVKPLVKRPILPGVGGRTIVDQNRDSQKSHVNVTVEVNRESTPRPRPSTSVGSQSTVVTRRVMCSPKKYGVRLWNGNCSSLVYTEVCVAIVMMKKQQIDYWFFEQMCYGQCTSYNFPRRSSFVKVEEARHGVERSCGCCSADQVSTKRYEVTCYVNDRGRKRVKTFYLPIAKSCRCRPCRRY